MASSNFYHQQPKASLPSWAVACSCLLAVAACAPDASSPAATIPLGELPVEILGSGGLTEARAAASLVDGALWIRVVSIHRGTQTTELDAEVVAYDEEGAVLDSSRVSLYSETHGILIGPRDPTVNAFDEMYGVDRLPASVSIRITEATPEPRYGEEAYCSDWEVFGAGTDAAFMEATLCRDDAAADRHIWLRCAFVDADGAPLGKTCRGEGFQSIETLTGPDGCSRMSTPSMALPEGAVPVIFPW